MVFWCFPMSILLISIIAKFSGTLSSVNVLQDIFLVTSSPSHTVSDSYLWALLSSFAGSIVMRQLKFISIYTIITTWVSKQQPAHWCQNIRKGTLNFHVDERQGLNTTVPITTARYRLTKVDRQKPGSLLDQWTGTMWRHWRGRKTTAYG